MHKDQSDNSTNASNNPSINDWKAVTLHARARALEPYAAYLDRAPSAAALAMVLAVKGKSGAAEQLGNRPLSGSDGTALRSALSRLGWHEETWVPCCLLQRESKRFVAVICSC